MCENYAHFDFRKIYQALFNFMTVDLSAFYFDIRKDTLYCDPHSSIERRACRTVMDIAFHCLTRWLAPVLVFTTEEVWQSRFGAIHSAFADFRDTEDADWTDTGTSRQMGTKSAIRRVVTGALPRGER